MTSTSVVKETKIWILSMGFYDICDRRLRQKQPFQVAEQYLSGTGTSGKQLREIIVDDGVVIRLILTVRAHGQVTVKARQRGIERLDVEAAAML
jgi:hypothetical protein